ncbi:hypothetical protein BDW02DRAFT_566297 [Decorospora gaudefroyi]|uniref:ORC6 first cyclin-like domain-containing protein n=1 Tax=Decorospora gaudefroyi TaxID=184978 RepID=A0A6A5KS37_9PLEO|nr:hypothetical protein BDW02DRAFT_566297 [Decorospora gaudefroyi]
MSRANIEQALTGLLPTLNGPLPPDLVELGLSLLTRSRSVATSMKPDEEIARPYACAQLACERSKKRLDLPTIASRPPCPPRIYKKLYNYLSSALPEARTTTRDPRIPRKPAASSAPASTRHTPLSARKTTTPRSTKRGNEKMGEAVPEWVMGPIRSLAKAFECPNTIPHTYTGVESVYPLLARMSAETPSKRRGTSAPASDMTDTCILSLVVVIFLLVFSRLADVDVTPEQYNEWLSKAVNTILAPQPSITSAQLLSAVEHAMGRAREEGWLSMQWIDSVKPQAAFDDEMQGVDETTDGMWKGKGLRSSSGSEYIGLGTMMQAANDFLGDRQLDEYRLWKTRVMARVREIEAA